MNRNKENGLLKFGKIRSSVPSLSIQISKFSYFGNILTHNEVLKDTFYEIKM